MSDEIIEFNKSDTVKLAVLNSRLGGVENLLGQHIVDDKSFQEKIFTYLQEKFTKVDELWDDMTSRNAKKTQLADFGVFANSIITVLISAGTAYIIMKYGNK